jgi:prepilin-type N-terminal cleavage/methylation domain-containing protein
MSFHLPRRYRTGFTLIEVLAACLLLGTLLTALLMTSSRLIKQSARSEHRILAQRLLDEQLHQLRYLGELNSAGKRGEFDSSSDYWWRSTTVGSETIESLTLYIVRFEVFARNDYSGDTPLATVTCLLDR